MIASGSAEDPAAGADCLVDLFISAKTYPRLLGRNSFELFDFEAGASIAPEEFSFFYGVQQGPDGVPTAVECPSGVDTLPPEGRGRGRRKADGQPWRKRRVIFLFRKDHESKECFWRFVY